MGSVTTNYNGTTFQWNVVIYTFLLKLANLKFKNIAYAENVAVIVKNFFILYHAAYKFL